MSESGLGVRVPKHHQNHALGRRDTLPDPLHFARMSAHEPFDLEYVRLILRSHERLLGAPLVPGMDLSVLLTRAPARFDQAARWLFAEAPFCLLAHSADPDPRFTYANQRALACFEYSWSELVGMPSRLSAEAPNREERDALLHAVASQGYAQGYRGLRVARSGRRFWIEDVTVWNLLDAQGRFQGQAATYRFTTPAA